MASVKSEREKEGNGEREEKGEGVRSDGAFDRSSDNFSGRKNG